MAYNRCYDSRIIIRLGGSAGEVINKLRNDKFSMKDLEKIADALLGANRLLNL